MNQSNTNSAPDWLGGIFDPSTEEVDTQAFLKDMPAAIRPTFEGFFNEVNERKGEINNGNIFEYPIGTNEEIRPVVDLLEKQIEQIRSAHRHRKLGIIYLVPSTHPEKNGKVWTIKLVQTLPQK